MKDKQINIKFPFELWRAIRRAQEDGQAGSFQEETVRALSSKFLNHEEGAMTMINDLTGKSRDFSAACYDNSVDELRQALENGPDETDCRQWGITGDEWTAAVQAALNEKEERSTF